MLENGVDWNEVFPEDSKVEIIFSRKDIKPILNLIGNNLNENQEIVDEKGNPEIAFDEGTIISKELGVVATGSKIFIRKNIASFNEYLASKK